MHFLIYKLKIYLNNVSTLYIYTLYCINEDVNQGNLKVHVK